MLSIAPVTQKVCSKTTSCCGHKRKIPRRTNVHCQGQTDSSVVARRTALLGLSAGFLSDLNETDASAEPQETSSGAKQVYLNIDVDRKPFGKVVIEIYDDVPIGGQRFLDLAIGKEGVRYRSSKFIRLAPDYVVNGGVKSLSLIEGVESPIAGGDSLQGLLKELDQHRHQHDTPGTVSLIIKSAEIRPVKKKLVAMKGKLITVEEGRAIGPNGTAFVITTAPVPALDTTNLVIGRIVDGIDVIQNLQTLPTVKDNTGSLFYQAAKQIGDPRADIARMSFNKPFNRIVISSSGAL